MLGLSDSTCNNSTALSPRNKSQAEDTFVKLPESGGSLEPDFVSRKALTGHINRKTTSWGTRRLDGQSYTQYGFQEARPSHISQPTTLSEEPRKRKLLAEDLQNRGDLREARVGEATAGQLPVPRKKAKLSADARANLAVFFSASRGNNNLRTRYTSGGSSREKHIHGKSNGGTRGQSVTNTVATASKQIRGVFGGALRRTDHDKDASKWWRKGRVIHSGSKADTLIPQRHLRTPFIILTEPSQVATTGSGTRWTPSAKSSVLFSPLVMETPTSTVSQPQVAARRPEAANLPALEIINMVNREPGSLVQTGKAAPNPENRSVVTESIQHRSEVSTQDTSVIRRGTSTDGATQLPIPSVPPSQAPLNIAPATKKSERCSTKILEELKRQVPHLTEETKCGNCGKVPRKYLVCVECLKTRYCGKYCQLWDWPLHELVCCRSVLAREQEVEQQKKWLEEYWSGAMDMLEHCSAGSRHELLQSEGAESIDTVDAVVHRDANKDDDSEARVPVVGAVVSRAEQDEDRSNMSGVTETRPPTPPSMYWSRAMSLHLARGGKFDSNFEKV